MNLARSVVTVSKKEIGLVVDRFMTRNELIAKATTAASAATSKSAAPTKKVAAPLQRGSMCVALENPSSGIAPGI